MNVEVKKDMVYHLVSAIHTSDIENYNGHREYWKWKPAIAGICDGNPDLYEWGIKLLCEKLEV